MSVRKKVGLALSGGAARGFAHLGVYKVLKENGIPIDCVAGTSAGSFAGAAIAAGMSVEDIIDVGKEISWYRMSKLNFSAKGLISNQPIGDLIQSRFPSKKIEDLMIPYAAIATDLESGKEVVFRDSGDLGFAVRASCAIPGIFAPLVDTEGNQYVDGGIVANVPTKAVRELGADVVIAVDVLHSGASYWGTPSSLVGIFFQSAMMVIRSASSAHHHMADHVVVPEIAHLRPDEIGKIEEFVELGEKAAKESLPRIEELIG
ncbi:MAG: patatin-like phospholipase family protein [Pyrinomonadaceae bacterium]|nr:patatin-like phospholipase family protein [Pyrinomonadaceae bacterium]